MVEATIDTQRRFARLAEELRRAALCTASPRTAAMRVRLIDDYLASVLVVNAGSASKMTSRNAFDQRRCRGRRAATAAWLALRQVDAQFEEYRDVAASLGLEAELATKLGRCV